MPCDITLARVTPDFWNTNTGQCEQFIREESVWHSIPVLNYAPTQNLKDQQLVRYVGMIQDMQNPEFYLSKYEIRSNLNGESFVRVGRFKDTITCKGDETFVENSRKNESSERQTWLCTPVPAINDWVSASGKKTHLKRQCEQPSEGFPEPAKKPMSEGTGGEVQPSSSSEVISLVLPEPHLRSCYLKLYDIDEKSFSLNDVVEVAGFLSVNNNDIEDNSEDSMEVETPEPDVPRLHVVSIVNIGRSNCLLPESVRDAGGVAQTIRKDLHLVLSQLLLGDTLAADYLLCHLVSSVYSRTDMMALGQLPLNISNVPKNATYPTEFYKVIQLLVMKSGFLPMTLDNLNKKEFTPRKDYRNNRLCGGLLQLSPGTHLVLDETQMQPGKLEASGLMNLTALKKVLTEQKVAYDFEYYKLDFDCDVPLLIFSEGKSLLPCDIVVPLEPDSSSLETISEIFQAAKYFLQPEILDKIRLYLIQCRTASFNMTAEMQQTVQEDFVNMRQNKEVNATAEDLHNLIVLSRWMAVTMGLDTLTPEVWQKTMSMEMQRKQRLITENASQS